MSLNTSCLSPVYFFNAYSKSDMLRLGNAFGCVAGALFERERKKYPKKDTSCILALEGKPDMGKSTFAKAAMNYLMDEGAPRGFHSGTTEIKRFKFSEEEHGIFFRGDLGIFQHIFEAKYGGLIYQESSEGGHPEDVTKHFWSNWIKPEAGIQHRIVDASLSGDFCLREHSVGPKPPQRQLPGIDFIEHADKVPPELVTAKISFRDQYNKRIVWIQVDREMSESRVMQEQFLPTVAELRC